MAERTLTDEEERARRFAALFYQELDAEGWGDIDPWLFKYFAEGADMLGKEEKESVTSLAKCLQRALDALFQEEGQANEYKDPIMTALKKMRGKQ